MTEFPSLRRLNVSYTLVHVVYWAMFAIFAGYQTSLLLGRGFTSGEAGIFASIRCFAGILAQPLLGGWADRHPEVPIKRLLNACLVLALGVNVVFYTTRPGFWGTALIFLTLGILELNAYPLLDSMAVQFIAAGVDMSYSLSRGLGSLSYALACVACGQQAVRFGTESLLLTQWQTKQQALTAAALAAFAVFTTAYGHDQWFLFAVLLGIGAKDVDLRRVLQVYLAAAAGGLLAVQLLHAATPLVPYLYYCRNWDYGYGHYNGYGARLAGVFFAWGWLRWPRLRWWDWGGLVALAAYTLLVPGCRGAGIAMVLLMVLFLLQRALPAFFESRIWHGMALAAAPLALGFSLLAGRLFDPDHPTVTPLLDKLNGLLSGRFEIWHHVFWGYPLYHPEQDGVPGWYHDAMPKAVTLLGGLATDGDEHHAIDNSFLAIPMNKGVLGAVVIGVIFLLLMWRLCQNRCTGETLFLTVILVYFLMENKCFLFSADPFILLLPAALFPAKGKPLPVVCPPVTRGCI